MKNIPIKGQPPISTTTIRAMLLRFAAERTGSTFCPSEVARAMAEDWRELMPFIREDGARLVARGSLRCTQRGQGCEPLSARGAIRFSAP